MVAIEEGEDFAYSFSLGGAAAAVQRGLDTGFAAVGPVERSLSSRALM
jgi:hypothetical protein